MGNGLSQHTPLLSSPYSVSNSGYFWDLLSSLLVYMRNVGDVSCSVPVPSPLDASVSPLPSVFHIALVPSLPSSVHCSLPGSTFALGVWYGVPCWRISPCIGMSHTSGFPCSSRSAWYFNFGDGPHLQQALMAGYFDFPGAVACASSRVPSSFSPFCPLILIGRIIVSSGLFSSLSLLHLWGGGGR